jgi:hypothetical protein
MIALIARWTSSARHRREERDLASACNTRVGADVASVDGGADYFRASKCMGVFLAPAGEPRYQLTDGRDPSGRIDLFFRLANAFTHPGEIQNLQTHLLSSVK